MEERENRSDWRPPSALDLLRTRFGIGSKYFHSLLCELEDLSGCRNVFEVSDSLLVEVQEEIEQTRFHPHYAEEYRRVEISYWGPILHVLRDRALDGKRYRACLDVGPGHGTLAVYAARLGWHPFAIDILPAFLSPQLIQKYHIQFQVANIEAGEVPWTTPFDVIIMTETLEHFNYDPRTTLTILRNHLATDGVLLLTTPDRFSGWGDARFRGPYWDLPPFDPSRAIEDPMGTHVKVFDKQELQHLLADAGFRALVFRHRLKGWRRGHLVAIGAKSGSGIDCLERANRAMHPHPSASAIRED